MYMHWVSDVAPKLPWRWMDMGVLGENGMHVHFTYLLLLVVVPLLLLSLWQRSR